MWIVSDKDDTKWLCETKPTREKNSWSDKGKCIMLGEFPFNNTPSFVNQIEWKDTPIQVKFELKKKMIVWITIPLIVGLYIGYTAYGLMKTLNIE